MTPEHDNARLWREAHRWSREELAALSGYSIAQIVDLEAGVNRGSGTEISPRVWRRYKLVCAGIEARGNFNWKVRK